MGYTDADWKAINTIRILAVRLKLPRHSKHFFCRAAPRTPWKLLSLALTSQYCPQVDATSKANSGHPGAPMGLAPAAHVLFNKFMTFNPKNPSWINRDRFVLS